MPVDLEMIDDESGDVPFLNGNVLVDNFEPWMQNYSEPFAHQSEAFYAQRFGKRAEPSKQFAVAASAPAGPSGSPQHGSHGPIVSAAIAVLQDGRTHTAEDILELALKRGLLDASATKKYVYTSLIEYIARAKGNGRKPAIVQNGDRSFRINEPPDDWPELPEEPAAQPSPQIATLIERLNQSAAGGSVAAATAFEQAVCDAFEALGFAATHLGGEKAPDGYVDAPLGALAIAP